MQSELGHCVDMEMQFVGEVYETLPVSFGAESVTNIVNWVNKIETMSLWYLK